MKYPMFDKNDNAILYEHEFPIILKCEKCGKSEKSSVYFSNHIPNAEGHRVRRVLHGRQRESGGVFYPRGAVRQLPMRFQRLVLRLQL